MCEKKTQSNNTRIDQSAYYHFWLDRSYLRSLVIRTRLPMIKNQMEKNREIFNRTIVVTASWISPEKTNAINNAIASGKIVFKGRNIFVPI